MTARPVVTAAAVADAPSAPQASSDLAPATPSTAGPVGQPAARPVRRSVVPRRNAWSVHAFAALTTAALGVTWWSLSGGADFQPQARPGVLALAPDMSPDLPTAVASGEPTGQAPAAIPAATQAAAADPVSPAPVINLADGTVTAPASVAGPPVLATRSAAANDAFAAEVAADPAAAGIGATTGVEMVSVVGDLVNLRDGPGTAFGVVTQLAGGDAAEVLGRENGWVYLRGPTGDIGWMADRFLAPIDG